MSNDRFNQGRHTPSSGGQQNPSQTPQGGLEKRGQEGHVPLKESYEHGGASPVTRLTNSGNNPPPPRE